MLHPSTKKLIDKLNEMTRKQRVAWIEGEDGSVMHDTEGYRVVLTGEPHGMLLTDALGREIETCRAEEFADEKDAAGRPYAQFVGELYRDAHRHARGAERAIRTLLAGLEAADEKPAPAKPAEPEPAPAQPDMTTDDTAQFDGETEITAAVATMAEAVNKSAAPPAEPAPEAVEHPEPAAAAEAPTTPAPAPAETQQPAPAPAEAHPPAPAPAENAAPAEPTHTPAPDPAPTPVPADEKPAMQAAPAGPMQQRFSLSGIPYSPPATGAVDAETACEPKPVQPRTLIIDGTEDLPDIIPGIPEPRPNVNAIDAVGEAPASEGEPGVPGTSRFNPWN